MLPVCACCWSTPGYRCAGRTSQLFGMVAVLLWVEEEGRMSQLPWMVAVLWMSQLPGAVAMLWMEEGQMNQLPEMMAVLWMEEGLPNVELVLSASQASRTDTRTNGVYCRRHARQRHLGAVRCRMSTVWGRI